MKRIFNWTFGAFFRTLGRILAFLILGALFTLFCIKNDIKIGKLIGIDYVSASENVNTNLNKYYMRWCDPSGNNCSWSSGLDMGTSTSYNSSMGILDGIRGRFGTTTKFLKGVKYRVKLNVAYGNANNCNWYNTTREVTCAGSLTNSWTSNTDFIESCQYISKSCYEIDGNTRAHYYFDIVPNTDVYGIQVNAYFDNVNYINLGSVNVMASSNVTYDRDTTDAINNSTTTIINNNKENTQEVINNQNQNTQEVINNQNQNTTIINNSINEQLGTKCENRININGITTGIIAENDGQYVDKSYNTTIDSISPKNGEITINTSSEWWGIVTDYIEVNKSTYYRLNYTLSKRHFVDIYEFDANKNYITYQQSWRDSGTDFIIMTTNNTKYVRIGFSSNYYNEMIILKLNFTEGNILRPFCEYGTYSSKIDETNNAINNLNDSINNDDSSGAQSEASDFFSNFTTNTHGLTGIITAPLNAIQSLTSKSCSPLVLPLPFVNQNLTLPCMREIYVQNFGSFMNIYDVITLGIISYWIMVRIFALVKDFKNPDHDEIEVMDL